MEISGDERRFYSGVILRARSLIYFPRRFLVGCRGSVKPKHGKMAVRITSIGIGSLFGAGP